MKCLNCIHLDKDYDNDKELRLFPIKRCNKGVITFKVNNDIYSINKKCDFFKVLW